MQVFLAHCFFTGNAEIESSSLFSFATVDLRAGYLGLDYFFVLSSFLLTWLALEERKKTGSFHPGLFLVRRGLRLWPLYFFLVLATYGLVEIISSSIPVSELPPIEIFLLFYSNIWISLHGQNFLFLLVFFWSIAAEEQFYLFWAFVLKFLNKYLKLVLFTMILISLAFRTYYVNNEPFLFFNTLSYFGNFAFGGLAAVLAFEDHSIVKYIRRMPKKYIALIYLLWTVLLTGYFSWFMSPFMVVIEKTIFNLFFIFAILEQCFAENSVFKLGKFKKMSYLGQLSLGLYCFHGVILTVAMKVIGNSSFSDSYWEVFLINPLAILTITIIISVISYELFEKRIHHLRRFFYPKTASKTSGV